MGPKLIVPRERPMILQRKYGQVVRGKRKQRFVSVTGGLLFTMRQSPSATRDLRAQQLGIQWLHQVPWNP